MSTYCMYKERFPKLPINLAVKALTLHKYVYKTSIFRKRVNIWLAVELGEEVEEEWSEGKRESKGEREAVSTQGIKK